MVRWKKHTAHRLSCGDSIDELLCWAWVDSVTGKVDGDRSKLRISPGNPNGAWSKVIRDNVARLRAAGRVKPPGEAVIAAAKANGMWTFLDDLERLEVPPDLADALGDLHPVWGAGPRLMERGALEWIKTAKAAPTREKRIADVVDSAAAGLRPSPFRC